MFFVTYILIVGVVLTNVVVGIIVDTFAEQQRAEELGLAKQHGRVKGAKLGRGMAGHQQLHQAA